MHDLFFYVKGKFLIHGCKLEQAENYGDFMVYSDSQLKISLLSYFSLGILGKVWYAKKSRRKWWNERDRYEAEREV